MNGQWFKGVAAVALSIAVVACDGVDMQIGEEGVPLAELDMTGTAPTRLVLAGPDNVVITEGAELAITVSGDADASEVLRFNIDGDTLGIKREEDSRAKGKATIQVTMPPATEFVLAGSGDIRAPAMVERAEVNIAGSGTVSVARVAAERLNVNMMGSGTLRAAGTAERLDFNVAGSGKLAARELKVDRADVNIAGSGGGEFASDGRVTANVAGSGDVTVYGRAECKINSMGSGSLRCREAGPAEAARIPAPTE